MLSPSNSVALDVGQRCQSLRKRRRLLVDAHLGERGRSVDTGFLWSTACPSTLLTPCSSLFRCPLEQVAESGERFDLERVNRTSSH